MKIENGANFSVVTKKDKWFVSSSYAPKVFFYFYMKSSGKYSFFSFCYNSSYGPFFSKVILSVFNQIWLYNKKLGQKIPEMSGSFVTPRL